MALLSLQNISRNFGTTRAVNDVSLDVAQGEFFGLLGPSGCGKTTTLRMIAGLEKPDAGAILFQDKDITDLPPERRGFGMVFQNYALFPHLNVFENVAFGLRARHAPKAETTDRVRSALELVQLPGYEKRAIDELSGGQQQRVAIARAIAIEPVLLLFDEPLSNLRSHSNWSNGPVTRNVQSTSSLAPSNNASQSRGRSRLSRCCFYLTSRCRISTFRCVNQRAASCANS